MAPEAAHRFDDDAANEREKQQFLAPTAPAVHRSRTDGIVPKLELSIADGHAAPFARSISEVPVSPLVAASTAGEHYPTNQLSYAHQQSVSGWDKVFASMSLRNEGGADEANHTHGSAGQRVPGLGEDSLAQGDVQYVYEYGSRQTIICMVSTHLVIRWTMTWPGACRRVQ
ncbi:hypothetical protein GGF43_002994 [Coemansia sp. RSA 2618]|nr:hypothetical protein GGF43_002994 [Coemansia sp. RSA 2618]